MNTYAAKVRRARDARLVAWRALITAYASGVDADATVIETHGLDVEISKAASVARAYLGEPA